MAQREIIPEQVLRARERAQLLVAADDVVKAIDQIAVRITLELADTNPILLCVLEGGLAFAGAIQMRLHFPLQADSVKVSSYGDALQASQLRWLAQPTLPLAGRTVLLLDDVLDKGQTLAELKRWALAAGARSVHSAVLVDKQVEGCQAQADFVALRCPDRYLFGWGMDLQGYWRNLDAVYALAEDDPLLRGGQ